MSDVLDGVRVVEVASWTFVPAAGAVLADWGADVLKIEHPRSGDPQRGLVTSGLVPGGAGSVNFMMEQPNRGKRSVGLDLAHPDGWELLMRLVESADVFLTNFLPDTRTRLKIDVDDLRARNPDIIYVRGSGQGVRGPDGGKGGYDSASYWARGGIGMSMSRKGQWPVEQSSPAFGDLMGGMTIAGGIAAALARRAMSGTPSVVDVSLLGIAAWTLSPLMVASRLFGLKEMPAREHARGGSGNPLVGTYRTADDRYISLVMLESDRFWGDLCERIGRPELVDDERFADHALRGENAEACIAALDEAFAEHTLAEWRELLAEAKGVWAPMQTTPELLDDPQIVENGHLIDMESPNGTPFTLVSNPVQFDETPPTLRCAPEHGQDTETVLLELGLDWEELASHKESGAIL